MKKILLIILLLLFAANAFGIKAGEHVIQVEINEAGFAKIVEWYTLEFEDILEGDSFSERAQKNSSSILAWKADLDFFSPRFESKSNRITDSSVSFDQTTNKIILAYELEKPLVTILKDEPRETRFRFFGNQLSYFIVEGIIVIPNNTTITIHFPVNAQIIGQETPAQAQLFENKLTLNGISTSGINIEYIITKPISTNVNSLQLIQDFFTNSSNIVVILIGLVILVIVLWKKDGIKKKIENYVVEHSEIEHGEVPEEVELEV